MKKKLLVASLALIGGLAICSTASAGISGSAHDFTGIAAYGTSETGDLCAPCHAPHNNKNDSGELLWNHTPTTATYTLYTNPDTFNGTTTTVGGVSKLCLGCHDGTVAPDSYTGHEGTDATVIIAQNANLGTTFKDDHPFSFVYNDALVTADANQSGGGVAGLELPATVIGKGLPLFGNVADALTMECATCHDVHNKHEKGLKGDGLLNVSNLNSGLCLACHKK